MPEGIILMILGVVCLVDTVSPQRIEQARVYGDLIGFVLYGGFLSLVPIIGGGVLCLWHRADLGKLRPLFNGSLRFPSVRRVVSTVLANKPIIAFSALILYLLLMPYMGYALTTFVFFYAVYGWQGFKWSLRNIMLSLVTVTAFLTLVYFAGIPVPKGIMLW